MLFQAKEKQEDLLVALRIFAQNAIKEIVNVLTSIRSTLLFITKDLNPGLTDTSILVKQEKFSITYVSI